MDEPTFRERGLLIVADDNQDHQEIIRDMLTEVAPTSAWRPTTRGLKRKGRA